MAGRLAQFNGDRLDDRALAVFLDHVNHRVLAAEHQRVLGHDRRHRRLPHGERHAGKHAGLEQRLAA
jgi:hypothetical protein